MTSHSGNCFSFVFALSRGECAGKARGSSGSMCPAATPSMRTQPAEGPRPPPPRGLASPNPGLAPELTWLHRD